MTLACECIILFEHNLFLSSRKVELILMVRRQWAQSHLAIW